MRRVGLIVLVCTGLVLAVVRNSVAEDAYRTALLVEQITVGSQEGRQPKFDFNDDRPWVCSMNKHLPAVEGKWHNLVDRLEAEMLLDQVVFEWFGSEKPDTIELKIGAKIPLRIAQATIAMFARPASAPVIVSVMTEDTDFGNTQRMYIGALVPTERAVTSPEQIEAVLKRDITHRQFLQIIAGWSD